MDNSLNYLEQKPPSVKPEIFAPGLISNQNEYEFGSIFNKNVSEFYYAVDVNGKSEIRYSILRDGHWAKPEILFSNESFGFNDPFLSPDEQRLYFISQMPNLENSDIKDYDIWYVNKLNNGWSEPINAGGNINSDKDEYYISFTKNGSMFFASNETSNNFDIYSSKFSNNKFQPAEKLGDSINTVYYEADVFIDYNEEYIIFCSQRPDGYGRGDLYISFKNKDGSWSKSKNLGHLINTSGHELCPFVSRDGKYFFYTSNEDIYWVDAKILLEFND